MRLTILSFVVISAFATGCSASGQAARHSSFPDTASNVADTSGDPSWTPPGQMDVSFGESRSSQAKAGPAESMPQPNKRQILRRQLRAAY